MDTAAPFFCGEAAQKGHIENFIAGWAYVLYKWQGNHEGPARSFDFDKSYDTVDVTRFLQEGANGISVLSMHLERGGVFAQLLLDDVLF